MTITISRARIQGGLLLAWAFVLTAGVAVEVAVAQELLPRDSGWLPLLSLSYESNLPTWFSSSLLLLAAVLAGLCARACGGRGVRHWRGLALVLGLISADEILQLHERMSLWFSFHGALTFGWVVPAAAFVLLFGLCYVPFLLRQPRHVRNGLVLAGSLYVGGALLMELPLGAWTEAKGMYNLGYALIDHLEEALEMLGAIAFISTTLRLLEGTPVEVRAPREAQKMGSAGSPAGSAASRSRVVKKRFKGRAATGR